MNARARLATALPLLLTGSLLLMGFKSWRGIRMFMPEGPRCGKYLLWKAFNNESLKVSCNVQVEYDWVDGWTDKIKVPQIASGHEGWTDPVETGASKGATFLSHRVLVGPPIVNPNEPRDADLLLDDDSLNWSLVLGPLPPLSPGRKPKADFDWRRYHLVVIEVLEEYVRSNMGVRSLKRRRYDCRYSAALTAPLTPGHCNPNIAVDVFQDHGEQPPSVEQPWSKARRLEIEPIASDTFAGLIGVAIPVELLGNAQDGRAPLNLAIRAAGFTEQHFRIVPEPTEVISYARVIVEGSSDARKSPTP